MLRPEHLWQPEELGSVLQHQLAAPLDFGQDAAPSAMPSPVESAGLSTVRELLENAHPPLTLLQQLKAFAKAQALDPNHLIPPEIAEVVYYAAIVAAMLQCGQRITQLDDDALRMGLNGLLERSWLDEGMRRLLTSGLAYFSKTSTL